MEILFPDLSVIETKDFDVHQDWEIPIEGFFILGAKDKSKRSISDFSNDELHELVDTLKKVRIAMKDVLDINDVYIFQNEDTVHGFHVWMFPRHDWMEPFGKKIESVRQIMKLATAERSKEPYLSAVKEAATKVKEYLKIH
jgi:diadenosine tetraphosphate (Ap4A) HIT family hydrolase